jgi:MFS family permease
VLQKILNQYPALSFVLYRRYWFASLASVGGWQISALAMGWLVFERSASPLDLGILGAAMATPAIFFTVAGGVIADRYEKRLILIITTSLNALLLFLLALLVYTELVTVWHIWLIAGAISFVSGVDWPTRQTFFPHLIERSALLSAVALNSVLWQVTRMVLPALGGILIAVSGPTLVFNLAAVGYVVMLTVIFNMKLTLPGQASASAWQQTLEGISYIASHKFFRNLIVLSYATMLFLSSYMQQMPAFAKLLDAGPEGFGILMSVTGIGSIVGTALSGAITAKDRFGLIMLGGALSATVLLAGFALATTLPSYTLALVFSLLAAIGTSVFLILSTTAIQAEVPEDLRGRVMGIHGITYSLMPMGALLTGALAPHYTSPGALLISLLIYLVILSIITLRSPNLRRMAAPTGHTP